MTNLLDNGRFYGNLDEWTGSGTIDRSLGYPRNGCVQLTAGQNISQQESVSEDSFYTLHYFFRLTSGATLTAGYGSGYTNSHADLTPGVWHEATLQFAPDVTLNESVTFAASGATAYVDAVTLLWGGLPLTRQEIARKTEARLGQLATGKSLICYSNGTGVNGDYTAAIDEALRNVGAIGMYGEPDITCLIPNSVNDALEQVYANMLQRLQSDYLLESDVSLGPRRESRSQIAKNMMDLAAGGAGNKRVEVGRLDRSGGWER